MGKITCIGFEGTAHTAGVGIVGDKCVVFANERHSIATEKGGLIPRELARHHTEYFPKLLKAALQKAGRGFVDADCVAYSAGPGIGAALSVAAVTARMVSALHEKPIVPVNHSVAHIEIAKKLCSSKDPLVLYVSGGNTQVIGYDSGRYRVYGETLDIGVGNLLDSFGRALGMGFPAGPLIDELYSGKRNYIELPYSVKGMDLNFSGLLTAAEKKIGAVRRQDLCYSLMHNAFAMVTEVCERALAHTGKKEMLLTGGVASSMALQEMMRGMCSARKVRLKICPKEFCQDNGAMIAWAGILKYRSGGGVRVEEAFTEQKFRTDSEKVDWV